MLINALRAHLAEFGIITAKGRIGLSTLLTLLKGKEGDLLPTLAREAMVSVGEQLAGIHDHILMIERKIVIWHRSNEQSKRLESIPGVGPITASAIAAKVADVSVFRSGRELAAWIGLAPRQNSSGGKEQLGHISKKGDRYIRSLLVLGAHAVLHYARESVPSEHKLGVIAARPQTF